MKRHSKAFSLVELVTVIAIVSIMLGVAVVSLLPARTSAKLDAAGREVAANIKLAQSYALQGKAVKDSGNNVVPCGYGVNIKDTTEYQIFYTYPKAATGIDCTEFNKIDSVKISLDWTDADITALEKYTSKDGVIFNDNVNKKIVYFTIPHGIMFGNDGNPFTGLSITLKASDGTTTKTVNVGPGGAVTEQ